MKEETYDFLIKNNFAPTSTVVMMTAVATKCAAIQTFTHANLEIVIMVTAGVGNGVDVTKTYLRDENRMLARSIHGCSLTGS